MNFRYLFLIGTASLVIPLSAAIAFSQTKSTTPSVSQEPNNPRSEQSRCSRPHPPMGDRRAGDSPEPPWARGLDLTTEQREQLKVLNEQARKDREELHQKLFEADRQMRELLAKDTSPEELRQQHQQVQKLRQQLDNQRFEKMLAERQVLTSEQRNQLNQNLPMRGDGPPPPPRGLGGEGMPIEGGQDADSTGI